MAKHARNAVPPGISGRHTPGLAKKSPRAQSIRSTHRGQPVAGHDHVEDEGGLGGGDGPRILEAAAFGQRIHQHGDGCRGELQSGYGGGLEGEGVRLGRRNLAEVIAPLQALEAGTCGQPLRVCRHGRPARKNKAGAHQPAPHHLDAVHVEDGGGLGGEVVGELALEEARLSKHPGLEGRGNGHVRRARRGQARGIEAEGLGPPM